jgi:hypothetical protein
LSKAIIHAEAPRADGDLARRAVYGSSVPRLMLNPLGLRLHERAGALDLGRLWIACQDELVGPSNAAIGVISPIAEDMPARTLARPAANSLLSNTRPGSA